MRTDPTDTGGLFAGRRPGTNQTRYRENPEYGSARRRRADRLLALWLLSFEALASLVMWVGMPIGGLWLAGRLQYVTGNVSLALALAFLILIAALLAGLVLLVKLDAAWVLVRRAAGYDQRSGTLPVVFGIIGIGVAGAFFFWLMFIRGPGSSTVPGAG